MLKKTFILIQVDGAIVAIIARHVIATCLRAKKSKIKGNGSERKKEREKDY